MKKLLHLILLAVLLSACWWLWNLFFPSVEKVLQQKMATLAAAATFEEKTNPITRATKAQKLTGMFSADAQLVLSAEGLANRTFSGRDEITEAAGAAFAAMRSLRVEFLDVSVHPDAGKQAAEVSCTAKVHFGDSKDYGLQEMRFLFRKKDGEWLIIRAECVRTLS